MEKMKWEKWSYVQLDYNKQRVQFLEINKIYKTYTLKTKVKRYTTGKK